MQFLLNGKWPFPYSKIRANLVFLVTGVPLWMPKVSVMNIVPASPKKSLGVYFNSISAELNLDVIIYSVFFLYVYLEYKYDNHLTHQKHEKNK